MPTSPTVFISYRRKSSVDLAQSLHRQLKDAGVDVFFDLDAIRGGEDYERRLKRELEDRDYLLVILAPDTLDQSQWVRREIATFLEFHKKIIPITTDGYTVTRETLPPEIANLAAHNYIPYERRYADAAFDAIKYALGITDSATNVSGVGTQHVVSAANPEPSARSGISNGMMTAIVTGVFAVIVALIGIVPKLLESSSPTPTPQPTQIVIAASATSLPPTATETPLPPTPEPSLTPLPPSATDVPSQTPVPPTTIPTMVSSAIPIVKAYPCEATVMQGGTSATLFNVRERPGSTEKILSTVRKDQKIRLRKKQTDNFGFSWYQIEDSQVNYLGWLESQYVSLSSACP